MQLSVQSSVDHARRRAVQCAVALRNHVAVAARWRAIGPIHLRAAVRAAKI
jgi:hypothetical protein